MKIIKIEDQENLAIQGQLSEKKQERNNLKSEKVEVHYSDITERYLSGNRKLEEWTIK